MMNTPSTIDLSRENLESEYLNAVRQNERLLEKVKERDGEIQSQRIRLADALGIDNGRLRLDYGFLIEEVERLRDERGEAFQILSEPAPRHARQNLVGLARQMVDNLNRALSECERLAARREKREPEVPPAGGEG